MSVYFFDDCNHTFHNWGYFLSRSKDLFIIDVFFGHNFLFFKDTFFTSDREPISNIEIKTKDFRAHILIFLDTFHFFFRSWAIFYFWTHSPLIILKIEGSVLGTFFIFFDDNGNTFQKSTIFTQKSSRLLFIKDKVPLHKPQPHPLKHPLPHP